MQSWTCIAPTQATRTRYQEIPQYAEGLYDLGKGIYAWMVPNGSWGESNAGLIVGEGESLLIDTLWDLNYTRAMLAAMHPFVENAPLRYVFNTHADGDHFWGNELLTSVETVTSEASREEMHKLKSRSMALIKMTGRLLSALKLFGADRAGHWLQQFVAPYDFRAVTVTPARRAFKGTLSLTFGGRTVEFIEVGPAHSQGDAMAYLPNEKILFSADVLFIGSTPVMWAGPVENWFAALDRILALDVDIIVPGHGPITDKEGVRQVKAYWEYVVAHVRSCHQKGMSAKAAAYAVACSPEFRRQPFAQWNSPERLIVSADTLYRNWRGNFAHRGPLEILDLLIKQGMLAHEFPEAQPAIMRKNSTYTAHG